MVEQIKTAEAALAPIVDQASSTTPFRDPVRLYKATMFGRCNLLADANHMA